MLNFETYLDQTETIYDTDHRAYEIVEYFNALGYEVCPMDGYTNIFVSGGVE